MNYLFSSLFGKQLVLVIQHKKYLDVRLPPAQLLQELRLEGQKFQKVDQDKRVRVLSVLGLLMAYSDEFYDLILENLQEEEKTDNWIGKQILRPFGRWVRKCCETSGLFMQIKRLSFDCGTIMDRLPYTITLLDQLLNIVKFIPNFGRYFDLSSDKKYYIMFSEVLMTLTNLIYSHLKKSIQHFLFNETQQKIQHHRQVMKWVFTEKLPGMNDILVRTTLNKHFLFHRKGIVTKTIKIEEYDAKTQAVIGGIIEGSEKSRETALSELQQQIFPQDGTFNEGLFISTLEGSFTSDFNSNPSDFLNKTVPYIKTQPPVANPHRPRK